MPGEISVERLQVYTPEDAAEIGRLMPHLSESFNDDPIPEDILRQIIESDDRAQFVARVSSRVVGAATLNTIVGVGSGRKAWLEDFVSDPNSGQRGVGQAIWTEMERWCRERDINTLEFTSRPSRGAAHNFYLKNGVQIRDTTAFRKLIE